MTRNPDITFTKKIFAQKSQALEVRVIAQIEALFVGFQIKTLGLNLYFKKCRIFEYI
jgi:hypothetical protein